jgi:HD-GYP domain-containing protein (c-di-GMP phosphodiesterase class II)
MIERRSRSERRSFIDRRPVRTGGVPAPLLAILDGAGYDGRLEKVLEYVSGMVALPDTYLYLAHAGGRHLHLARSRVTAAAAPARETPAERSPSLIGGHDEGGTAWSVGTPPFEIALREGEDRLRVLDTPAGRLLSLPLHVSGGSFVGVIQAGPLTESEPPKSVARYAELEPTLATIVATAAREEAVRLRAELAEARLDGTRRLAASALDVKKLIGLLLDLALASTQSEAGFVAIVDEAGGLSVVDQRGLDGTVLERISLHPDTGMFDWSLGEFGGGLILRDIELATELGIRSVLAVPLIEQDERLGIFALLNFGDAGTFGERSLELLAAFADQIRLMLHNARTFGEYSERYLETMVGLASSLDAGRAGHAEHHRRVSAVGRILAAGLGLGAAQVEAIGTAGLIHDIGMATTAGVEGAFEADIQHPAVGASLVEHLPLHRSVAQAIAGHHEWFDGWGFPEGLEGRAIPRAGRVLAMAEFLVEMSSPDVIRAAWTAEQLVDEVRQRRGSQFDPEVADLTVKLVESRAADLLAVLTAADQSTDEG